MKTVTKVNLVQLTCDKCGTQEEFIEGTSKHFSYDATLSMDHGIHVNFVVNLCDSCANNAQLTYKSGK